MANTITTNGKASDNRILIVLLEEMSEEDINSIQSEIGGIGGVKEVYKDEGNDTSNKFRLPFDPQDWKLTTENEVETTSDKG